MDRFRDHLDRISASARGPWSEQAFVCHRCPGAGCPAWWKEEWQREHPDGTVELVSNEGCGFRLAQGMFVRAIAGSAIVEKVVQEKADEIVENQKGAAEGLRATLRGVLMLAAQRSGNPAAVAIAPLLPRLLRSARRLLPGKKTPPPETG
jgi:hypothetical protein